MSNAAYVEWKSRPGLPSGPDSFKEEQRIKAIRAEIASRVEAPDGADVVQIPVRGDADIALDGRFSEGEWAGAVVVPVGPRRQRNQPALRRQAREPVRAVVVRGRRLITRA